MEFTEKSAGTVQVTLSDGSTFNLREEGVAGAPKTVRVLRVSQVEPFGVGLVVRPEAGNVVSIGAK